MRGLPKVVDEWDSLNWDSNSQGGVLLVGEGFERRSLSFLEASRNRVSFSKIFIFQNHPSRESRLKELQKLAKKACLGEIKIVQYDRTQPNLCEKEITEIVGSLTDEKILVIDISVFSRLLIVMLLYQIRKTKIKLRFIYSEPDSYSPSKEEFDSWRLVRQAELGAFTSSGIHDVMRTPALSSTVMLGAPVVLIAFASFNAHLLSGLLSSISPTRLIVLGANPPRFNWRRLAVSQIHEQLCSEFFDGNPLDCDGALVNETSTLYYDQTVEMLTLLYKKYCFTHRIIVSPTGSKMQALGVGIFRALCDDVHVEYPMPQRYASKNYSSEKVHKIRCIEFESLSDCLSSLKGQLEPDGDWG